MNSKSGKSPTPSSDSKPHGYGDGPKGEKKVLVDVVAVVYPEKSLFLRTAVGTAKDDNSGEVYEMSLNAGATPLVRLPDKRWVIFQWRELIEAATKAGEKAK